MLMLHLITVKIYKKDFIGDLKGSLLRSLCLIKGKALEKFAGKNYTEKKNRTLTPDMRYKCRFVSAQPIAFLLQIHCFSSFFQLLNCIT